MKIGTYVLVVSGALIIMALGTKDARPTVGVHPGDLAPGIESFEKETPISFRNQSDRYTLLNFWAAYDAESRVRNIRLANEVNKMNPGRIAFRSFSVDEKESIFAETVKADKLDQSMQFRDPQGTASVLYKMYNRKGGFGNFLINDEGIIVARNVMPDKLAAIINHP